MLVSKRPFVVSDSFDQSKAFRRARRLNKGKQRTQAFRQLNQDHGFLEYSLHSFATTLRRSWLGQHIDSNTAQKLASRAFSATQEYAFKKRGKPRFKGKRGLRSLEGKTNATGIRFVQGEFRWKKLCISPIYREDDKVVQHGLSQRVKYCRVLRKTIRGKQRWYVQLILEGIPYIKEKNRPGSRIVALDVGPSAIAIVDDEQARLLTFCDELADKDREIRLLQRAMDRSRRANNPENYNEDGTIKKGKKQWKFSRRYRELQAKKAELERCLAEHRRTLHGQLSNEIIRRGKFVRSEKVSYLSFQKNFGKSVGRRAPGMLMGKVARKAASAGGQLEEISTYQTALSQTCFCGEREKKPLSQRQHACKCGVKAQRDLFSAYLARHVYENKLDVAGARKGWPGVEPLLRAASSAFEMAKRRRSAPLSLPCLEGQSHSSAELGETVSEAGDVVAQESSCEREPPKAGRAPLQLEFPFDSGVSS